MESLEGDGEFWGITGKMTVSLLIIFVIEASSLCVAQQTEAPAIENMEFIKMENDS